MTNWMLFGGIIEMSDWNTIPQMIRSQAKRYGRKAALRTKQGGQYVGISWNELAEKTDQVALALMDLGVKPEDRVAIFYENTDRTLYLLKSLAPQ